VTDPLVAYLRFERCPECGELSVVDMEIGELSGVGAKWAFRKSVEPCDHFIVDSLEVRRQSPAPMN
jgi:hypothetical protein